jgi:importin subunit alpha-6/7
LPGVFSKALREENITQLTDLAQAIRKIVSVDDYPPIEQLIQSGILPEILTLLDKKFAKHQDLLIEICWIIANVSSSNTEHVAKLIELNVVPKAIDLLQSKSEEINDNIIWILANIAGDSFQHRDILLRSNIVEKLDHIVTMKPFQPSFLNNVSWLISNLCRGKPYPQFDKIAPLLRIIKLLIQLDSPTMLINCLFALSYLTEGDNEQIDIVLSYHMTPRIIDLLSSTNHEIQAPALRTIGNLLTGDDSHAQVNHLPFL